MKKSIVIEVLEMGGGGPWKRKGGKLEDALNKILKVGMYLSGNTIMIFWDYYYNIILLLLMTINELLINY